MVKRIHSVLLNLFCSFRYPFVIKSVCLRSLLLSLFLIPFSIGTFAQGNALDFNGVSDYVDLYNTASMQPTTFTIEFWLKLDANATIWDGVIDKGRYNSSSDWFFLLYQGSKTIIFGLPDGNTHLYVGLNDSYWHHVACNYDGEHTHCYLDGALVATSANPYTSYTPSANPIRIGSTLLYGYETNMHIDELRIWEGIRTADEIRGNMCRPLASPLTESNLLAYYNCDALPGGILTDNSGNGHYGTLTGGPDLVSSDAFNMWDGTQSTDWDDANNWSLGVAPTSTSSAGIYGSPSYQPSLSSIGSTDEVKAMVVGEGNTFTIPSGEDFTATNIYVLGNMTIESDADGTGSVITTGDIAGSVNVKRYITEDLWHLIATPTTSSTASVFEGDYLQYWTESTAAWTDVTETTYELTPAMGYGLWGVARGNHTYTFSGTANNGNQSLAITDVGSGGSYNGANLLGNPYPSSIDWSGLDDTYGAVYYWNGSAYVSWNAGSGDGSQYIPPMQGFFIIADGNGTFSVSNSDRTHSGATSYYKSASAVEQGLVLYADNGNYRDALWILQREEASAGFDYHSDALKFMSNTPGLAQLWSVSTDGNLSIDSRPYQESIALGFANDVAGFYSIGIDQIAGITIATLEDTQENVFHDLTKGAYSFTWDPADDEGRFILHLGPTGVEDSPQMNNDLLIYAHDGDLHLKAVTGTQQGVLTITDMAGRTLYQSELTIDGEMKLDTGLSTGVYVVRFNTGKDVRVKKIIIN